MRSSSVRSHRLRTWGLAAALVTGGCASASRPVETAGGAEPSPSTTLTSATTGSSTGEGNQVWWGRLRFEVLDEIPHDSTAFTQGLELVDGVLAESTGLYGSSDRRLVDPRTGAVLAEVELEPELFGEGLTERDGRLYQLTWQAGRLLVSDVQTLAAVDELGYDGEGWGICTADGLPGRPFIMSDGSATLTVRDPVTFAVRDQLAVRRSDGSEVTALNELECVGSQVLANVWKSTEIVVIDMATGLIDATAELAGLVPAEVDAGREVLNGIAYDDAAGTLFVTGKNWPVLYEIRLVADG